MYERLSSHFEDMCIGYFGLTKTTRLSLAVDWYDVGCMQYYLGRFCLWCKHDTGIFALLHQPGDRLLGYVLLVHGCVVEFFTNLADPLDWWAWNRRHKPDDVRRRPFYVDRGFVSSAAARVEQQRECSANNPRCGPITNAVSRAFVV